MSKGTKTEGGRVRMIGLPAKGRQETDCSQINKTLCLYISSAPESQMLLRNRTIGTACSQESFELLCCLNSDSPACAAVGFVHLLCRLTPSLNDCVLICFGRHYLCLLPCKTKKKNNLTATGCLLNLGSRAPRSTCWCSDLTGVGPWCIRCARKPAFCCWLEQLQRPSRVLKTTF